MVPSDPEPKLRNQSIREKAIVIKTRAIRILKAVPFKIACCWSARQTEYRGLEDRWTLVAESHAQPIFIGKVGVHFTVNEIRIFVKSKQRSVVAKVARKIWRRQEGHELSGNGINHGHRNDFGATSGAGPDRIECVYQSIGTLYRSHTRPSSGAPRRPS